MKIKTTVLSASLLLLLLNGCTTSKDKILPADSNMLQIWQEGAGGSQQAQHARTVLRRPLTSAEQAVQAEDALSYSRTQYNEISQQFPRLPNPDMVMYVFPHLSSGAPVPGYSTVFPLHTRTQYALPGERTGAL